METLNKQSVMDVLVNNTCDILYRKKDGTERVVKATLQESVVPKTTGTGTQSDTKGRGSSTCVTVFDVEKSEWRTLIIGNILHFGKGF
jgi:hypothetical protein